MISLDLELRNLEILYDALERKLDVQYRNLAGHSPADDPKQQDSADLIEQVEQAGRRVAELAGRCSDPNTTADSCPEVTARAALLQQRVGHLLGLVARNAAGFEHMRTAARQSLQDLRQGAQFLHSARVRGEYRPRFFDARE